MAAGDVIDPDTRRTLASGRRTIGEMIGAVQSKLRRVFIVFVVVLLATVVAMRVWIWPVLERDLLAQGADIVVITPFDVILLQAKIGILVGVLVSIPPLLYYGREPLKRRGLYPEEGIPLWKLGGLSALSLVLFIGGVVYSYTVFFPVMFSFLADNAINAGLAPTYSIVDWTQFILVLGLSFGLAAQLPLLMPALAYANIVPYETFRDKWKYAVVGMFGFGALFSPPDPFTQIMWAGPLVALYGLSLYLTRVAVGFKRGGGVADLRAGVRTNGHKLAAAAVLAGGLAYWLLADGIVAIEAAVLPRLPAGVRPTTLHPGGHLPLSGTVQAVVVGAAIGVAVALALLLYYGRPSLEADRFGEPAAIDLGALDAEGVRAAPPEAFEALDEADVLALASRSMDDDEPATAQALLDRYDAVVADAADEPAETGEPAAEGGGAVTRTTAGFVTALTDSETTEDDIGGYYHDLAFIFASLRSKAFRVFAVFMAVLVGVFGFLYSGGIGAIKDDFLRRLPAIVRPEEVNVITLHPVEALVFEVKIATLLGIVATVPLLLYYAWPAASERGLVTGDRNVFFGWAGAIFGGLLLGSTVGYLYIAPAVVSYFVWDAFQANMIIAYRVSNFFWLIFFTTVGIGLLIDIPVTMVMFHRGGIVSFATMRARWRVVTLGVMALTAVFTPASVLSMILVAIPVMFGYALGLGALWVYTVGGRRPRYPAARSG